jgi:monofunctional glycosyltransferase
VIRRTLRVLVVLGAAAFAFFAYSYLTLPDVRTLATTNPSSTAFMRIRAEEARRDGKKLRHVHRWVPYSRISRNLTRAVIVTEDAAFWDHEGIDLEAIRDAIETGLERGVFRGASTITQQLAKNLYLSESQDPVRKLRELIIARRMEAALSKARILEIYLNVVEWGDGVWGAEAAARTYFGVSAAALSRDQAALLAGALINPRVYSPARPPSRLLRRQRIILARMGGVRLPAPPTVIVPPSSIASPDKATAPADELDAVPESTGDYVSEDGNPEVSAPDTPAAAAESPTPQ